MSSLSPAAAACFSALEADPRQAHVWEDLLYHLGCGDTATDVWAALPLMAQYGINRVAVFINACSRLTEDGLDPMRFYPLTPLTVDPLSAVFASIVGCFCGRQAYLQRYDLDAACTAYDHALQAFPFAALTARFSTLGTAEEQATAQEFLWTRGFSPLFALRPRAYSAVSPPEEAPLPWPVLSTAGDFLVMASADDRYCQIYGERLLQSVAEHFPQTACLLHVMNPTVAGDSIRKDWQQRYPFVSFVCESAPSEPPYYAARRFMVINAVRRHYQRDMLLMDMDGYVEKGMAGLVRQLRGTPLGLVFRKVVPVRSGQPNILYDAFIDARCIYVAADSGLAEQFFARVHAYLHHKIAMEEVFWCWDETALCHAWSCLDPAEQDAVVNMVLLDADILQHGIATGNLHVKTQGLTMTSDQPFAQRTLARILNRLFDPARTPHPFRMLLHAPYLPPILTPEP